MEAARRRCEAPASAAAPYNGMNEKLFRLLSCCRALITARNAFKGSSLEIKKSSVEVLESLLPSVDSPQLQCATLFDEVQVMRTDIEYFECLTILQAGLRPGSPVTYFIPVTNTSTSDAAGTDSTLSPTRRDSNSAPNDLGLWQGIIAEENLCLNTAILDTEKLTEGLAMSMRVQKRLEDQGHKLPPEYDFHVRAAELIKTLRQSARTGRWPEAANAYDFIKLEGLAERVPIIQEEILGASDPINNYTAIVVCKKALQKGMGTGAVGAMMRPLIVLDDLDAAIRQCMLAGGAKSTHAETLIKAVVKISATDAGSKTLAIVAVVDPVRLLIFFAVTVKVGATA
jgi:hypothetical protein